MLVEDRVKIGDLSIHRRSLHTQLLVEFPDVIAVIETAHGVNGIVIVVERLVDVLHKGNLAIDGVNDTVSRGYVCLCDIDALDGIAL